MQKCMDWRAVKFDWNRARAFLVTAEEGSLSAAARALGMAQPTLGRQVAELEAELGVALFERAGRGLMLTPSGAELVDHVRAMGDAAARVSLTASGQSQAIEGQIRITASEVYAAHLLPAVLSRLRRQAPGIEVEIVATNSLADLRRREADIALRNARPEDPELIARKLGDHTATLYATPDYLARLGAPPTAADLAHADFIGFRDNARLVEGLNARGLSVTAERFRIISDNHLVQWEMVRAGLGIGVMASDIGDADSAVRRVLPNLAPFGFPLWLIAHRELNTSARVRLVFDLIAEELTPR